MAPQELMMYWGMEIPVKVPSAYVLIENPGYKFENLAVLRKTWDESTREAIEGREDDIVNNAAQYCSVVRTGIGNTRMVLGGEVDASGYHRRRSVPVLTLTTNSLGQQTMEKRCTNQLG